MCSGKSTPFKDPDLKRVQLPIYYGLNMDPQKSVSNITVKII